MFAVASLTEHVTMMFRSDSDASSTSVWPPFWTSPEIISESAKLAEHPYASTKILAMPYPNKVSTSLSVISSFDTTSSLMVFPVFSDSLNSSADFR